jgi:SAM-dependent MidA family methyltransferase
MQGVQTALTSILQQQIQAHGPIDFATFMQAALYHPEHGYYSQKPEVFGKHGDFFTAPELGAGFAYTILQALQPACLQYWQQEGTLHIVEIGAGTGKLAAQLLSYCQQQFPAALWQHLRYTIVEISAARRREQQQQLIVYQERVQWLTTLPTNFSGIIIANEVLDAMPVHLLEWQPQTGWHELYVHWDAVNSRFTLQPTALSLALQQYLATQQLLEPTYPTRYQSEVALASQAWCHQLGQALQYGWLLLCDYGYPQAEYYHPRRQHGNMGCYQGHHWHQELCANPGMQDITCFVNFDMVANALIETGMQIESFQSLAQFLYEHQLAEYQAQQQQQRSSAELLSLSEELNILSSPAHMGEVFKVLIAKKAIK